MLHIEMALEEDLGIDSIKRVEIISSLQEHFPVIESMSPEDLSEIRSIEDLVLAISDRPSASPEVSQEAPVEVASKEEVTPSTSAGLSLLKQQFLR